MAFGKQGSRRLKIVEWTDHEKAAALWARLLADNGGDVLKAEAQLQQGLADQARRRADLAALKQAIAELKAEGKL